MANRQIPASLRGIVELKRARVFRVHFYCEACPNEFTDEMLTVSHSYCPCCDARIEPEPGSWDEYEEERPEFTDLPDMEDE